jgi:defect-in-organelle-trafficking protein DotC
MQGTLFGEDKELTRLKTLKGSGSSKESDSLLRDKAQKEAAYSTAIQLGTNSRYREILKTVVEPLEKSLDSIFDFKRLMIREGDISVIPPVLSEAGKALRVGESGKSAVYQEQSFLMVSKAKIVPVSPNWREYLFIDLKNPSDIHESLFPQNMKERSLWQERVQKGWEIGIEQGDLLFKNQVAKLTRDYTGLLLYEELKAKKQLETPTIENKAIGEKVTQNELVHGLKSYELSFDGGFEKKPTTDISQ